MRRFAPLLLVLATAPPAHAAAPPVAISLANRPGVTRLAVTSPPGSLISGALAVTSTGSGSTSLTLAPADAVTAPRTGERYVTGGKLTGVGSWIHLAQTQVTASGGGKVQVGFSVAVPGKLKPGQYVGGIVSESPRLAITLVITVPGTQTARFAIGVATARSPHLVTIHVANDGNVVRDPTGTVAIANRRGVTVATKSFHMADFLPQSSIEYPLVFAKPLAVGTYVATVRLTYPAADGTPQTASAAPRLLVRPAPVVTTPKPKPKPTTTVTEHRRVIEWSRVVYTGAALVALVLLLLVLRRRRRAPAPAIRLAHEGPHYWRVDWDQRDVGADGSLRHLHHCHDCGVEVMARDVREASLSSR
jgi:hypothetical protein